MKCFGKKFGFGFMRLPEIEKGVYDVEECKKMVDTFMNAGFTYFDTAHGYCDGQSEVVLKQALVDRYPRESYTITDKLSDGHFNSQEEIRPLLETQLKAVGVDYFDYWLMHAQGKENFPKYKKCRAYETAFELKKEGKIKHVGISFHDSAETLDLILTEYPEIEAVQLQFNYFDYNSASVQGKECYEVCVKHNKPVIVMEPVHGGKLANVPEEVHKLFAELGDMSDASYAIRFAAGFDNVAMVLSGMSNTAMVEDNVSYMKDFKPLDEKEQQAVAKATEIFKAMDDIPCTGCNYCTEQCPQNIAIPDIFTCLNERNRTGNAHSDFGYANKVADFGKASDCVKCGLCEHACPQHIEIRKLLEKAAKIFE